MDQTRREFLQTAAALTGSGFAWNTLPESIARAFKINPAENTTFLDAEHIVILMQENRSFDHSYGSLQGVRGFRDPRAHVLPNGNKVWFQTDAEGNTHAPFRLDMKGSNVTWVGGLPHSWPDQVDARNGGHMDKWLVAKARKDRPYAMGFYTREDLPFYYALADAFTVCDQAFCSSLTGTTPNRLYLWSGTIREDASHPARVQNGDTDYEAEAAWTTFPERLQKAGISWHVYQNEISLYSGFVGEQDAWLSNFTDNPLEWMSQYNVRFSSSRRRFVKQFIEDSPARIKALEDAIAKESDDAKKQKLSKDLQTLNTQVADGRQEQSLYNDETWAALPEDQKELHRHAFGTNAADPDYRTLAPLSYKEDAEERTLNVPKGDTLFQFRKDVDEGKLPAVSWIVAPETFSDHPGSAWFGAWYVSEVLNILTKNPEVWKKTIFVLCYDENDGYFDHIPPFTAPDPRNTLTGGFASHGINTKIDWSYEHKRSNSIGLGFRVPLVVASPWSRGGCVNSQVFDHTSVIQLVEAWLAGKDKDVTEANISPWRRTVCGDMTSIFRPYNGESYTLPLPLDRDETIIGIHKAKFLEPMAGISPLTAEEVQSANVGVAQEPGTRPSCPLPYQLEANVKFNGGNLELSLESRADRFGAKTAGAPFNFWITQAEVVTARAYAVKPGDMVKDFLAFGYPSDIRIQGPNGFMRRFETTLEAAEFSIYVEAVDDHLEISLHNGTRQALPVTLTDESYGAQPQQTTVNSGASQTLKVDPKANGGWYDFTVETTGHRYRYAGRVETGEWTTTDPAMA
jgi:phospholipase C